MREPKKLYSGLGILGVILCAACCALPIVGVMLGVGTLSWMSKYFEWAGIAAIVLSVVFFLIYVIRRKKRRGCDSGCCENKTLSESKTVEM